MERQNAELPEHLQTEILLWMPPKTLHRCIIVSKRWASIIRGKDFKDRYVLRSMTRPRLLFAFGLKDMLFHSVYQEEKPLLSSGQQQMRFSAELEYEIIAAVRGLVCLRSENEVVLCNPGTKKIVSLPEFEARAAYSKCYFGYDEVTKVFKVLSSEFVESSAVMQHQVFTVGSGENSWRQIVCEQPYTPFTNGLCIGGVLYYGALPLSNNAMGLNLIESSENKPIVISFNVRSEEFDVTELPEGVKVQNSTRLVNYNGEVCLVNHSEKDFYDNGDFQICVRDKSAGEWRVKRVVIPGWRDNVEVMTCSFEGTIGTGELIFATQSVLDGSHFVLYYDTVTENVRKFKVKGMGVGSYHCAGTFLNHIDSLYLT